MSDLIKETPESSLTSSLGENTTRIQGLGNETAENQPDTLITEHLTCRDLRNTLVYQTYVTESGISLEQT